MAVKVLGQAAPSATVNTDLYMTPVGKASVCSTLAVCNRGASAITYRVAVRPAGAVLVDHHYIAYDVSLANNATDLWTIGISLSATDVVTVYASAATASFSLFGDES